jgi:hypothetical protein
MTREGAGVNVREEIEALVSFEGRGPGSDAERRAAGHLTERLEELGRNAETEGVVAYPRWALTYAIHAAVAVIGSVVSVTVPVIGAVLVLLAVLLTFLDAGGMALTTRRLLGRRSSQNVISTEDGDKSGDIYLVAHYDAGRSGLAFNQTLQERRAALSQRVTTIGPMQPLFWTMVAVLICVLLRLPGVDSQILTIIQFVFTVLLILALPALIDTAISSSVPGANDNASGVALALALAERFGGKLEHFDVNLLLTGSQEALGAGMRSFLKKRKGDLDAISTIFLNLDEVGRGTVRFTTREGLLLPIKSHEQLVTVCEEIAEDAAPDDEDDDHDEEDDDDGDDEHTPVIRAMESRTPSDAYAARGAGFPAITVTCKGRLDYTPGHHQPTDQPDRIDDDAIQRAYDFSAELIERLDQSIGPDLERPPEQSLLNEDED